MNVKVEAMVLCLFKTIGDSFLGEVNWLQVSCGSIVLMTVLTSTSGIGT